MGRARSSRSFHGMLSSFTPSLSHLLKSVSKEGCFVMEGTPGAVRVHHGREPLVKKHFHCYTDVRWRGIHGTWHRLKGPCGWLQDAMDKAVKNKVAKAVVPAIGAVYEALR